MSTPEHGKNGREITYRIGWKRVRIHYRDRSSPSCSRPPTPRIEAAARWARAYLWREAPYPGEKTLACILWGLSAASFAAIVWLVYRLASVS